VKIKSAFQNYSGSRFFFLLRPGRNPSPITITSYECDMIIISLGSNVTSRWGNPSTTILRACEELNSAAIDIIRISALYRTSPYGIHDQPDFVNAAAMIDSTLSPIALLDKLKKVEAKAGRRTSLRWGPRPLDIDIIDYKAQVFNWHKRSRHRLGYFSRTLILPHPEVQSRIFVLRPLHDIAPDWHHPVTGASVSQLLVKLRCKNEGNILDQIE
jgi:2-amino-4-hydroxy-6-hydroxymethyldihydropteridine diphosphokinase